MLDLEGSEDLLEKFQVIQNEVDELWDVLNFFNREKMDLEKRNIIFEEREEVINKVRKDENEGDQEKIVLEVFIQFLENEVIQVVVYDNEVFLELFFVQFMFFDSENIQRVKDDVFNVQFELEKVKLVNECLKVKLRILMRKIKDVKLEVGYEGSKEEIVVELNKVC